MFSAYFFTVALPAIKTVLALAALFAFVWFVLSLFAHAGQQYGSNEQKTKARNGIGALFVIAWVAFIGFLLIPSESQMQRMGTTQKADNDQ